MLEKAGKNGESARGQVAVIPISFFYELLEMCKNGGMEGISRVSDV